MRSASSVLLIAASLSLYGQDQPLTSLPYTPVLDTRFIDKSADPCADFYQYACGNWSKLNPIPSDHARWNVYSKLTDENQRFLWGILQNAEKGGENRTPNEQKIGDFFHACMDETAAERAGAHAIQPQLDRIEALSNVHDIASFVAGEHVVGNDGGLLFSFGSGQDYNDATSVIAFASAGGLGLPDRDYYTKSDAKSQETRAKYLAHIQRMFELQGESPAASKADAAVVMRIETRLAEAMLTRVEKRDPHKLKHLYRRQAFKAVTPSFDWDTYLTGLSAPAFDSVNVTEPKFFEVLERELAAEPLSSWKTYFRWHVLLNDGSWLSSSFADEHFAFYGKFLTGAKQMPPRWKRCTRLIDDQMGEALGQVFVAKTFAPSTKEDALRVTREIEQTMDADLRELTWMSEATKQKALEKLKTIANKIGYPDRWRDYSSVVIMPGELLTDIHRTEAFELHRDMRKIGKPVDRTEWDMSPPTVNAYYDPQLNDVNFPAGVLQPPLFDPKLDAAPNYGNTAATIGHELTHAFDDEGRQFDAQGNLKDWWTESDAHAFEERVTCVRKQYAEYKVIDDIKINSQLTLGEDVADLGGTLLAYVAWKNVTANQKLEPIEELTPDQRFFIGMAQWACGEERPELKRLNAVTDPHSPDEYRINGVVANLPEFGQAFSCKVGQPMMRTNACRVW